MKISIKRKIKIEPVKCNIDYDFILKQENANNENDFLLKTAGWKVKFPKVYKFFILISLDLKNLDSRFDKLR